MSQPVSASKTVTVVKRKEPPSSSCKRKIDDGVDSLKKSRRRHSYPPKRLVFQSDQLNEAPPVPSRHETLNDAPYERPIKKFKPAPVPDPSSVACLCDGEKKPKATVECPTQVAAAKPTATTNTSSSSTNSNNRNLINQLPDDLLTRIFSFLGGGVGNPLDSRVSNLRETISLKVAKAVATNLQRVCPKWEKLVQSKRSVILGNLKVSLNFYEVQDRQWIKDNQGRISYLDYTFYSGHGRKRCHRQEPSVSQMLQVLKTILQENDTSLLVNLYLNGYFLLSHTQQQELLDIMDQKCPLLEKRWIGEHQACFFKKPTSIHKSNKKNKTKAAAKK